LNIAARTKSIAYLNDYYEKRQMTGIYAAVTTQLRLMMVKISSNIPKHERPILYKKSRHKKELLAEYKNEIAQHEAAKKICP